MMRSITDQYLARVSLWLGRRPNRDDILRELRSAIHDRVEELEHGRGRTATDSDLREILKDFGPPPVVASRFSGTQPLISSEWAHVYWRVLLLGLAAILLAQLGALAGRTAFGADFLAAVKLGWTGLVQALLIGFTATTLTFVMLDHGWQRICCARRLGDKPELER